MVDYKEIKLGSPEHDIYMQGVHYGLGLADGVLTGMILVGRVDKELADKLSKVTQYCVYELYIKEGWNRLVSDVSK